MIVIITYLLLLLILEDLYLRECAQDQFYRVISILKTILRQKRTKKNLMGCKFNAECVWNFTIKQETSKEFCAFRTHFELHVPRFL